MPGGYLTLSLVSPQQMLRARIHTHTHARTRTHTHTPVVMIKNVSTDIASFPTGAELSH